MNTLLYNLCENKYLRKSVNFKGEPIFKLYEGNQILITTYNQKCRELRSVLSLLRKDKKSRLFLNRKKIIQLHGNDKRKKQYKSILQQIKVNTSA